MPALSSGQFDSWMESEKQRNEWWDLSKMNGKNILYRQTDGRTNKQTNRQTLQLPHNDQLTSLGNPKSDSEFSFQT